MLKLWLLMWLRRWRACDVARGAPWLCLMAVTQRCGWQCGVASTWRRASCSGPWHRGRQACTLGSPPACASAGLLTVQALPHVASCPRHMAWSHMYGTHIYPTNQASGATARDVLDLHNVLAHVQFATGLAAHAAPAQHAGKPAPEAEPAAEHGTTAAMSQPLSEDAPPAAMPKRKRSRSEGSKQQASQRARKAADKELAPPAKKTKKTKQRAGQDPRAALRTSAKAAAAQAHEADDEPSGRDAGEETASDGDASESQPESANAKPPPSYPLRGGALSLLVEQPSASVAQGTAGATALAYALEHGLSSRAGSTETSLALEQDPLAVRPWPAHVSVTVVKDGAALADMAPTVPDIVPGLECAASAEHPLAQSVCETYCRIAAHLYSSSSVARR